jgi:hypothetical protein
MNSEAAITRCGEYEHAAAKSFTLWRVATFPNLVLSDFTRFSLALSTLRRVHSLDTRCSVLLNFENMSLLTLLALHAL